MTPVLVVGSLLAVATRVVAPLPDEPCSSCDSDIDKVIAKLQVLGHYNLLYVSNYAGVLGCFNQSLTSLGSMFTVEETGRYPNASEYEVTRNASGCFHSDNFFVRVVTLDSCPDMSVVYKCFFGSMEGTPPAIFVVLPPETSCVEKGACELESHQMSIKELLKQCPQEKTPC